MSKNIRTQLGKVIGKTLNSYHTRVKPIIDDLKFKEQYQGRIIDCMVGEVDDNYIETPETDSAIVKLEHSKEGLVKIPSIKGKTILVDSEGNETDTPGEGCRLVSVGEDESNKMIILSKNSDSSLHHKTEILLDKSLKKLPNGVCDEVVGNKLIRRIGKLVLNGTESWSYSPPSSHSPAHPTGEGFFMINNGEFIDNVKSDSNLNNGFCNIFSINKNFYDANFYSNLQGIGWQNYFDNKYIFIRATKQFPSNSVEEFKNYLKDNNVVLYYELKEPIIEELPNGITLQGFDETTMYVENSITPVISYGYNALIPYKEELSKQKEEVETNTLDIENNIIPYLMDMEFNLMLMEDNE